MASLEAAQQQSSIENKLLKRTLQKISTENAILRDRKRLLTAGTTWDFITSHDLYRRGLVDIGDVCERLKHYAQCDGRGSAFSEQDIIAAIKQSIANSDDDLL